MYRDMVKDMHLNLVAESSRKREERRQLAIESKDEEEVKKDH